MAAENTNCLACGDIASKGARSSASAVSFLLNRYLTQRCQEMNIEIDVQNLISTSWVCRTCSKAYSTHQEKEDRLFAATANAINLLQVPCTSNTPSRKRPSSVGQAATNKKLCSSSPPVTVTYNYYFCMMA